MQAPPPKGTPADKAATDATAPCTAGCPGMADKAWYKRGHAWVLDRYAAGYNARVDAKKRGLLGDLSGDVLEIGAGSGANIGYYPSGLRWTALEPNDFAHDYLRRKAAERGLDATIVTGTAEHLPLPDRSQDAVVSTLVLCTVRDPDRSLAEIRRVLKPGGRFVFVEHVGAPTGTTLRGVQRRIKPLWRWLADGCEPDRDTGDRIAAAGFATVDIEPFRLPYPIVGPHIAGSAVK